MLSRRTLLQAATAATVSYATRAIAAPAHIKWLAYYGQTAEAQALVGYDIVVLDPDFRGAIPAVSKAVCGYLSLGETRQTALYQHIDPAALLAENPTWNTRQIDVRNPAWGELILSKIIPTIIERGFTGLMFDTLDTPPYLEQLSSRLYGGMTDAAVKLVQAIRKEHPKLMLVMNRGYAILPRVLDSIDAVIAESFLTSGSTIQTATPGGAGYDWNRPEAVTQQLALLMPARDRNIPVLSLDYWEPTDTHTIAQIYLRERLLSHHPYVATALLDRIVPEPALTSVPISGL